MRVSNSTLQQSMMLELQRAQNAFSDAQQKVASGKAGNTLADYGSKTEIIAAGRLAGARTEQRIALATELETRFDTQAITLKSVSDAAQDLQQEVFNAIGANNGASIATALNTAFSTTLTAFNSQINGQYLFGGTRSDAKPVNLVTIDDLAAAPSVASIFQNNATKPTADLGTGPLEVGQLASDVSTPMFQAIKNIKDYIVANGNFGAPLTDAQVTFLKSQLPQLDSAATSTVAAEGINGAAAKQADTIKAQQDDLRIALGHFVSNVEDADIVEASTQVQQSQLAYEAAAQTLSKLNSLSLLDFLR